MEFDLLKKYPKTKRTNSDRTDKNDTLAREENRRIARRFDKEFFDGSRETGYGGYRYKPEYWQGVVRSMYERYWWGDINANRSILDVGCGKGFTLAVIKKAFPLFSVCGVDISDYAIENGHWSVKPFLQKGCASDLSRFEDNEFDFAFSINTVHNLCYDKCIDAILELQRVSKKCFISVDAWDNEEEELVMRDWNLTAKTMMSCKEWRDLFETIGYKGDYFWFKP